MAMIGLLVRSICKPYREAQASCDDAIEDNLSRDALRHAHL